MNRKALQIGFVVAAISVVLLFVYMRQYEAEAPDTVDILALRHGLASGEPIRTEALVIRQVSPANIEDRHIRATEQGRVLGLRTAHDLPADHALLWSDLETPVEGRRDLSDLLRPGMRAVNVPLDSRDEVLASLRPGDRVDVLFTTTWPGTEEEMTMVLLQNIMVLVIGDEAVDESAERMSDVSLGVVVEHVTLLTHALAAGKVEIVPRPAGGFEVVDLEDVTNEYLIEPATRQTARRQR